MKTVQDIDVRGKRVFVRVDFNVPLDDRGEIADDTRIAAALPTLTHLLERGAGVIAASHLGRPKGKVVDAFSLAPVARRLGERLGKTVPLAPDCVGPDVQAMVGRLSGGEAVLLENLRFHAGEEANDDGFARQLAALCDVYVNDAFAVSHRAHASVAAVTGHVSQCAAGMLLQRELDYFDKAMSAPERPLVAIIGGAKVSSKLAALKNMLRQVDAIIIGGAMANTFLKASGRDVGRSRVEEEMVPVAADVLARAGAGNVAVHLPVDVVAAGELSADAETQIAPVSAIPPRAMALDIGPETIERYDAVIRKARTIVWNGPMGVFEVEAFSNGTMAVARSVAAADALSIVGGGDTDAAVHRSGVADRIGYISTGGGAFLTLLEGRTLVAVAALS